MKKWIPLLALLVAAPALAQTAEDVGDVDSFARKKLYLGRVNLATLYASDLCSVGGGDACMSLPVQPATTAIDRPDLGTLRLPARAANSLICLDVIPNIAMAAYNRTGATAARNFVLRLNVRVRNAALTGTDPTTHRPFNGELTFLVGLMKDSGTMYAGDEASSTQYAGQTCILGGLNKQMLRTTYGLSRQAADNFFNNNETTITFGLTGTLKLVTTLLTDIRVRAFGD